MENRSQRKLRNCNWQRVCNWLKTWKRGKSQGLPNRVSVNWILAQGQWANRCEGSVPSSKIVQLALYSLKPELLWSSTLWFDFQQKMMYSYMYNALWGDIGKCNANGSKKNKLVMSFQIWCYCLDKAQNMEIFHFISLSFS